MSHLINPILCKNYEDCQSYTPAKHYLKHWPDMWPEEAMADRSLWEEHKTMSERFPIFMLDNLQWCLHHCDRKTWARRVPFALASLVRECRWKVRNYEDIDRYGVSPIYETDPRRMQDWEDEELVKSHGIEIDLKLLARMMGDMMPIYTIRKHRVIVRHPMNREGIQTYALATLVIENRWKCEEPNRHNNYKSFYKVT